MQLVANNLYLNSNSNQAADLRYKTRICANWQACGACPVGASCHFAHGRHELRSLNPSAWTELCSFVAQPSGLPCPRGDNCHFAHSLEELRALPPAQRPAPLPAPKCHVRPEAHLNAPAASSNGALNSHLNRAPLAAFHNPLPFNGPSQQPTLPAANARPAAYRTALCKFFAQGACLRGPDCNFAHGEQELRLAPAIPGHGATPPTGHNTYCALPNTPPLGACCNLDHDSTDHLDRLVVRELAGLTPTPRRQHSEPSALPPLSDFGQLTLDLEDSPSTPSTAGSTAPTVVNFPLPLIHAPPLHLHTHRDTHTSLRSHTPAGVAGFDAPREQGQTQRGDLQLPDCVACKRGGAARCWFSGCQHLCMCRECAAGLQSFFSNAAGQGEAPCPLCYKPSRVVCLLA